MVPVMVPVQVLRFYDWFQWFQYVDRARIGDVTGDFYKYLLEPEPLEPTGNVA